MKVTSSRSAPWKTNWLTLAVTLGIVGCQSLPNTAACPKPKEMPELVKQPVPTENQLDAMKKRIGDFETTSSQAGP